MRNAWAIRGRDRDERWPLWAETLSEAKNVAIDSLVNAGFLEAKSGKVRLLKREELSKEWNPKTSTHLTVWEVMQRLIHALLDGKGESEVGDISRRASEKAEIARDRAYRLYTVCERKGWAQEALAYNSLVTSWSEVSRLAHREASDVGLWAGTFWGEHFDNMHFKRADKWTSWRVSKFSNN